VDHPEVTFSATFPHAFGVDDAHSLKVALKRSYRSIRIHRAEYERVVNRLTVK
jgi:hypothetical protein